jgi:hypothetical protein
MGVGSVTLAVIALLVVVNLGGDPDEPPGSTTVVTELGATTVASLDGTVWRPEPVFGAPEFDAAIATVNRRITTGVPLGDGTLLIGYGSFGGDVNGAAWHLSGGSIRPLPSQMNPFGAGQPVEHVWAAAASEDRIVVAGDRGSEQAVAFYSDDEGASWNEASIDANGLADGALRAVTNTAGGFIGAGHTLPENEDDRRVALWRSADGAAWVQTPAPDLGSAIAELDSVATSGDVVVVSGRRGDDDLGQMRAIALVSTDGGGSWSQADVEHERDNTRMHEVLWTGQEFLGFGWSDPARPVVWRSGDGSSWSIVWSGAEFQNDRHGVMRRAAMFGSDIVVVGFTRDDGAIRPVAWTRDGDDWARQDWPAGTVGVPTFVGGADGGVAVAGYGRSGDRREVPMAWLVNAS